MRPTLKRSPNPEGQSRLPLVAVYRQRELITRKWYYSLAPMLRRGEVKAR
jgi:hypothetical protein